MIPVPGLGKAGYDCLGELSDRAFPRDPDFIEVRKEGIVSQLSILVVDDETEVCLFLERFLVAEGHFVRTIDDPTRAVEALRETVFNVIILDLSMPKLSGMDLLKEVRQADAEIAAVIITGKPTVESASESIVHGVSGYIQKPFTLEEIREVLNHIAKQKGLAPLTEEDLHRPIGTNIRESRRSRGLTLQQVAQRSSLSIGLLSKLERAESGVSLSSLYKVAGALDIKLNEIVGDF